VIVVRMISGLGNQLFQYACGRALSQHRGQQLWLDPSFYATQTLRTFYLDRLRIQARVAGPLAQRALARYFKGRRNVLRFTVNRLCPPLRLRWITDPMRGPDFTLFDGPGGLYLDGYWASEAYFAGIRSQLLSESMPVEELDPPNSALRQEILAQEHAVCVHVRRGDYVHDPETARRFGFIGLEYYQAAWRFLAQRVPVSSFYVFSDDPAWTQAHVHPPGKVRYVTHNAPEEPWKDLTLMRCCRHFIMANSSFSWWAAWLSDLPGKQVIAPRRFHADGRPEAPGVIPEPWHRI
jgi:hypothetical protein